MTWTLTSIQGLAYTNYKPCINGLMKYGKKWKIIKYFTKYSDRIQILHIANISIGDMIIRSNLLQQQSKSRIELHVNSNLHLKLACLVLLSKWRTELLSDIKLDFSCQNAWVGLWVWSICFWSRNVFEFLLHVAPVY